jgi:DNA-binding response OmpR family regulator
MPAKILVVDDDRSVLSVVKKYLNTNGFAVVITDDGSEALLLARDSKPDLILCDSDMPGLDGPALCRAIKREGSRAIPVVIMSGERIGDKDILQGFEGGADDYVLKPFSLSILLARLRAVMRRYEAVQGNEASLLKCGIELDPAGRTVKIGRAPVSLTRKEFDLLAALISRPGRVLSITYLLETVWGYDPADYNDPGTVEVHVYHLRKKLGPKLAKLIVNLPGHGYKFDASAN